MSSKIFNPGENDVPEGTYTEVDSQGNTVSGARTVNVSRGDRLPPTSQDGYKWTQKS